MSRLLSATLLSTIVIAATSSRADATTYRFTVNCQAGNSVAEWNTGAIDPGKEYLRTITGVRNAGCVIGDYNESTDAGFPKNEYSGAQGVLQGTPPIAIICGIFGC
jgi:hypothetical protein